MVFIESKAFTRRLDALAGASTGDVLQRIQSDLSDDPERGDLVRGLGGVRKARVANPRRGKGKRGGLRYLYLFLKLEQQVHLLFLIDKDEQADLSREQRAVIVALVEQLKR